MFECYILFKLMAFVTMLSYNKFISPLKGVNHEFLWLINRFFHALLRYYHVNVYRSANFTTTEDDCQTQTLHMFIVNGALYKKVLLESCHNHHFWFYVKHRY